MNPLAMTLRMHLGFGQLLLPLLSQRSFLPCRLGIATSIPGETGTNTVQRRRQLRRLHQPPDMHLRHRRHSPPPNPVTNLSTRINQPPSTSQTSHSRIPPMFRPERLVRRIPAEHWSPSQLLCRVAQQTSVRATPITRERREPWGLCGRETCYSSRKGSDVSPLFVSAVSC